MSKIRLTVNGITDVDLLAMGRKHQGAMKDNSNFPEPVPDEAAFDAATETWHSQIQGVQLALAAYKQALAAKAAGRMVYENVLRQRANHVEAVSAGNRAKMVSAGFDLRRDGERLGTLPEPRSFTATMSEFRGQIRLRWKRVRGAVAYQAEYQRREDELKGGAWIALTPCTAAKTVVDGLESGVEYVFRVAAIGTAGPSPWSDPAFMMAP